MHLSQTKPSAQTAGTKDEQVNQVEEILKKITNDSHDLTSHEHVEHPKPKDNSESVNH